MRMHHLVALIVLVCATLLSSHLALAQFAQQGPKSVGSGVVGANAQQGYSVSLSAAGNTAIVGGPGDNSDAGAAWVFAVEKRPESDYDCDGKTDIAVWRPSTPVYGRLVHPEVQRRLQLRHLPGGAVG